MLRNLLILLVSISLSACSSNAVDGIDARDVKAQTSDGSEILLLCSEEPAGTAEQISKAKGVEIREMKGGETFAFDQPFEVNGEVQQVVVSQIETEPCISGIERQDAVDATNLGLGLIILPIALPLMILLSPGFSFSMEPA